MNLHLFLSSSTLKNFVISLSFSLLFLEVNAQNQNPIARLTMSKGTFSDECVFYFQAGGDTLWQPSYDAYKLIGPNTSAWVACLKGSVLTGISGLPALPLNLDIKVKAISTTNCTYTFSLQRENFPDNVCVQLFDTYTQQSANLISSQYVCQLYDTTSIARFRIQFYTGVTEGNTALTAATCAKPNSARISARGAGAGPWNYEWFFQDSLVKQNLQVSFSDSMTNLQYGVWKLKINPVGTCLYYTKTYTVSAIKIPVAKFEMNHSQLNVSAAHELVLNNLSVYGESYRWNFGDGSACSTEFEPNHTYSLAGIFDIRLTSISESGCKDSITKSIQLIWTTVGLASLKGGTQKNSFEIVRSSEHDLELQINLQDKVAFRIVILDTRGGVLLDRAYPAGSESLIFTPLSFTRDELLVVKLLTDSYSVSKKVVIKDL